MVEVIYTTTSGVPVSGGIAAMIAAAAVLAAVAALAVAIWNCRRAKRILKRLDSMLDEAIAGTFAEQNFDESQLSTVEAKFAHYLASNAVSA